jgi:PKD repeat protein
MASATTFVVDRSAAGAPCTAASPICNSIFAANEAVADGDIVEIKPHDQAYIEQPIVVKKRNVTFTAASGPGTVTVTGENWDADIFQLGDGNRAPGPGRRGDGTVLRNLTIVGHRDGGSPVFVMANNTLVDTCKLVRLDFSERDVAVYDVSDDVIGTNTLKSSVVGQAPRDTPANDSPAVMGGRQSTLIITDSFIVAGYNGSAVELVGNDSTQVPDPDGGNPDFVPIDNEITRSVIAVAGANANALEIISPWDGPVDKGVVVEDSILSGGEHGVGLLAHTEAAPSGGGSVGSIPPGGAAASDAGDIFVDVVHTTVAGADNGVVLRAAAGGSTSVLSGVSAAAPGNIFVDFDRSIVHGGALVYNNTGTSVPGVGGSLANTVILRIFDSDTWAQPEGSGAGGEASILTIGTTNNPDSALFADAARRNYHLRPSAPVIDKGGKPKVNESDRDIDGDPRSVGPAADWGADEFVNKAPTAALTANPAAPKIKAPVTFDGSGSRDAEAAAGGSITEYRWSFGDGATQTTTTPTVQHAYSKVGTYQATLIVIDNNGAASAPAAVPMRVADGTGPKVAITSPKAGQRLRMKAAAKSKRAPAAKGKAKTVRGKAAATDAPAAKKPAAKKPAAKQPATKPGVIRFAGTATDDSGVGSVEISLRRVSGGRSVRAAAKTSSAQCTFFDGKRRFLRKACKKPTFFRVSRRGDAWAYRIKAGTFLRTGTYVLTARGIDKDGNIGKPVTRRFTVR